MSDVMNNPFTGSLVDDMETAKKLIANHLSVDFKMLLRVASDGGQPESARIAAIYTLGFTDDDGKSRSALARIVASPFEPEIVRDHAAEAVGYMDQT